MRKNMFDAFENADSSEVEILSGYIMPDDDAAKRIFQKSLSKYNNMTFSAEAFGNRKNLTCISGVSEKKGLSRPWKIGLSGIAAVCALGLGFTALQPMLSAPEPVKNEVYTPVSVNNVESIQHYQMWKGRELRTAVPPERASKDDIFHLMLNSIDYFDKASGTVYCPVGTNFDMVSKIDFQTVLSESKAYQHYTSYYIDDMNTSDMADIKEISNKPTQSVDDMEFFCDVKKNICISSNNISKEYENTDWCVTMDSAEEIEDDERVTVNSDGQPCYSYRADPTNVPDASSVCLFAQGLTMGYLQDFDQWDIKGIGKYEDKECLCISGTASKEYGAKHNVTKFDFWVDVKTGVLLQYVGYDENGCISDYIYTENIALDNSALDVKKFSETYVDGYRMIS